MKQQGSVPGIAPFFAALNAARSLSPFSTTARIPRREDDPGEVKPSRPSQMRSASPSLAADLPVGRDDERESGN